MAKTAYVDNNKLLEELRIRKGDVVKALSLGVEPPLPSSYIGNSILEICTRLSYSPNFIGYTFREDMIGDAILNCVAAIDKFDETKSPNPFGYFTQIAYYAFLVRIDKEKDQSYIKGKMLQFLPMDAFIESECGEFDIPVIETLRQNSFFDTDEYERKQKEKKQKLKDRKANKES